MTFMIDILSLCPGVYLGNSHWDHFHRMGEFEEESHYIWGLRPGHVGLFGLYVSDIDIKGRVHIEDLCPGPSL